MTYKDIPIGTEFTWKGIHGQVIAYTAQCIKFVFKGERLPKYKYVNGSNYINLNQINKTNFHVRETLS